MASSVTVSSAMASSAPLIVGISTLGSLSSAMPSALLLDTVLPTAPGVTVPSADIGPVSATSYVASEATTAVATGLPPISYYVTNGEVPATYLPSETLITPALPTSMVTYTSSSLPAESSLPSYNPSNSASPRSIKLNGLLLATLAATLLLV